MEEEKIEVIEEEDELPENYKEEEMTEDEKVQAQFNVDSLESNLKTTEFDLGQMNYQLEKMLPQRQAGIAAKEEIRKKEIELGRFKEQFKMYKRRVRTGKKRVPAIINTVTTE